MDEAEIFYHGLSGHALLSLEVEPMLVEDGEVPYYNGMMLLLGLATDDEDVVHLNDYSSLVYEFLEDVIHHCLKCHWAVVRFKPGSALLDPGRGQPMSLGPLGWSVMSSDGLVHPRKIVQVYLTCPHSH